MIWKTKSRSCRQVRKEEASVRRSPKEWEEEQTQTQRVASGRNEGATVGPAVDPARHQDANGESGGNLNTPRNGLCARESSRSPRGRRNKMKEASGWKMASSRKEKGGEVEKEEQEKEGKGKAQKSEMVEEMQRAHHKSVVDGNEERPKKDGR